MRVLSAMMAHLDDLVSQCAQDLVKDEFLYGAVDDAEYFLRVRRLEEESSSERSVDGNFGQVVVGAAEAHHRHAA